MVRPFGQARGFRDALVKAGATGAEADALITALDKIVDFRHGQPEHELVFERDADGALHGFEYRAGITERFRAERNPTAKFTGSRVKVDVERRRIAKGGYVSDSLGQRARGARARRTAWPASSWRRSRARSTSRRTRARATASA